MQNLRTVPLIPFIPDDKYFLLNRGNLLQHFQMQLSQNRRPFPLFFNFFSKFRVSFEHFQEKDDPHTLNVFLNLQTSKNVVR